MAKIQISPDSSATIKPGSFTPAPFPIPANHFVDKFPDGPPARHDPTAPADPQATPVTAPSGHVVDPAPPPVQPLVS
jgi:hypothetical protein